MTEEITPTHQKLMAQCAVAMRSRIIHGAQQNFAALQKFGVPRDTAAGSVAASILHAGADFSTLVGYPVEGDVVRTAIRAAVEVLVEEQEKQREGGD